MIRRGDSTLGWFAIGTLQGDVEAKTAKFEPFLVV